MASNYIPQVDYTSRDYASISDDLLNTVAPSLFPEWTSRDDSDFGVVLIQLFAYMGDLLNYYIDRAANEGFLQTASQRSSLLNIARMLDYTPDPVKPATVLLTFTNSQNVDQTVPALTQIATTTIVSGSQPSYVSTSQVIFETDSDVLVPANGSASVTATQGVTFSNVNIGHSYGKSDQQFLIPDAPIIPSSVTAVVNGVTFVEVQKLADYTYADYVFEVQTDEYGNSFIVFGDNVTGAVPAVGDVIATYRVGGGAVGNVPAGTINNPLNLALGGIVVTNGMAAAGGSDAESNDSIRQNIPVSFKSINRAVSLKDYASLAINYSGVAKAIASGDGYNNVNLYIAPSGDNGYTTTLKASVSSSAISAKLADYTWGTGSVVRTGQVIYISDGTSSEAVTLSYSGLTESYTGSFTASATSIQVGTSSTNNPVAGSFVNGTILYIVDGVTSTTNEYVTVSSASRSTNYTTLTVSALANSYTNPLVYWVNFATGLAQNHSSGVTVKSWDTDNFQNLAGQVLTFITDKTPPSTTVTVLQPTFIPVNLNLNVTVLPTSKQSVALDNLTTALQSLFSFDNVLFADRINVQDVASVISGILEISYADITMMARNDYAQSGVSNIVCATNEIPMLGTITLGSVTGGI